MRPNTTNQPATKNDIVAAFGALALKTRNAKDRALKIILLRVLKICLPFTAKYLEKRHLSLKKSMKNHKSFWVT